MRACCSFSCGQSSCFHASWNPCVMTLTHIMLCKQNVIHKVLVRMLCTNLISKSNIKWISGAYKFTVWDYSLRKMKFLLAALAALGETCSPETYCWLSVGAQTSTLCDVARTYTTGPYCLRVDKKFSTFSFFGNFRSVHKLCFRIKTIKGLEICQYLSLKLSGTIGWNDQHGL